MISIKTPVFYLIQNKGFYSFYTIAANYAVLFEIIYYKWCFDERGDRRHSIRNLYRLRWSIFSTYYFRYFHFISWKTCQIMLWSFPSRYIVTENWSMLLLRLVYITTAGYAKSWINVNLLFVFCCLVKFEYLALKFPIKWN